MMGQKVFGWTCVVLLAAVSGVASHESQKPDDAEPLGYRIARRGTATVEDAYRLFAAMAVEHGRLPADTGQDDVCFDHLAGQLAELCVIDRAWNFRPTDCLQRDALAYMCCSYLGYRPGLVAGSLGMTRRYAHREMAYRGVITQGPPHTLVSGSELLSVSTRVSQRFQPRRDVKLSEKEIH